MIPLTRWPAAVLSVCFVLLLTTEHLEAAGALGGRRPLVLTLNDEWIGNGVAFSPYRDGQTPDGPELPSPAQILADLRLTLRYWKFIRMYDCRPVAEETLRLIRAERLPMRMMLGVWILPENSPEAKARNRAEIKKAIQLARAFPEEVLAVSVGNESCVDWSDHRITPAELIGHIREVRAAVDQPVTTDDDHNFWNKEESRAVAAEVDFIALHAHPLWLSQQADGAVDWLARTYDKAVSFHTGIPVIIGETGWATRHDPSRLGPGDEGTLMKGDASEAGQLIYLRHHYQWVRERRVPTILFEAFDENWKGGGERTPAEVAEKHWGVFTTARRPKSSFKAIIREFYPAGK